MIVVGDASPLIGLAAIGQFDLPRRLYSEIVIPASVRGEILEGEGRPGTKELLEADWIRCQVTTREALEAGFFIHQSLFDRVLAAAGEGSAEPHP